MKLPDNQFGGCPVFFDDVDSVGEFDCITVAASVLVNSPSFHVENADVLALFSGVKHVSIIGKGCFLLFS